MNRFTEVILILIVGATLLPIINLVLGNLNDELVAGVPGLTTVESTIMSFYPYVLLVAVFVAIVIVMKGKKKKE